MLLCSNTVLLNLYKSIHKFICFQIVDYTVPHLSEWSFWKVVCSSNLRARNNYLKLIHPFQKTNETKSTFIGPSMWNKTPEVLWKSNNTNTFKCNWKRYYLTQLIQTEIKLWYHYRNYHFANYLLLISLLLIIIGTTY